jgi:hypothetical protein
MSSEALAKENCRITAQTSFRKRQKVTAPLFGAGRFDFPVNTGKIQVLDIVKMVCNRPIVVVMTMVRSK